MSPRNTGVPAVVLDFGEQRTFLAGDVVRGQVALDVALAQQEQIDKVSLKVRGMVHIMITFKQGEGTNTIRETTPLIQQDIKLWRRDGGMPPQSSSQILTLPFTFTLAKDLPPSCFATFWHGRGSITYGIEVVAERPGRRRSADESVLRAFAVVPRGSAPDIALAAALYEGWTGKVLEHTHEKRIRTSLWSERSLVQMELRVADVPAFPIGVPIPFTLRIVTQTKVMDKTEHPTDGKGKPLFPAPPELFSDVHMNLINHAMLKIGKRVLNGEPELALTFEEATTRWSSVNEEWLLESSGTKARGRWQRSVEYSGRFTCACPPSFALANFASNYALAVRVSFPGLGNDLKAEWPVTIRSVADPSDANKALPELDLPSIYWDPDAHIWELDQKRPVRRDRKYYY